MSQHYNAFISYKHGPLDNKVAAEIQTQLERFRIPKAIREKTGIQKIDRIFRDKEELNITSDLNETIETALEHSDFLIVICSSHTKESIWVEREIEFFLKSHPMQNIMTVVCEGEPIDVVPEILFYKEMELMTEDGNVELVKVPMEPLSCDYRMDFRKARKEELPRLAAAILGCGYDDLRQRQRRYRQRRNAILASAAGIALASLAGYYAYTAAQIQANLNQSLINQSEYLAAESQKMLEQGDRMTAMLLAKAALPSEGNERPVTASAQLALSNALYAYLPQGGNMRGASVGIKKSFDHGGAIDQYLITQDAKYLAVAHSGDSLTIWDFAAGEVLYEERFNSGFQNMAFTNENTLIFVTNVEIMCIDPASGEKLWSTYHVYDASYDGSIFRSSFVSLNLAISPTEPLMALENGNALYFIDTVTGEILHTYEEDVTGYPEEEQAYLGFSHLTFSSDGKQLAGAFTHSSNIYKDKQPFLYDIEKDSIYFVSDYLPRFEAIAFTPEGNLIVAGSYIADEFSYSSDEFDYYYINEMNVNCYAPEDDELIWTNRFAFADYYEETHILFSDFLLEDESTGTAVICGAANTVVALDLSTGETLSTLSFEDTVLYLEAQNSHATVTMKNGRIAIGYWDQFIGSTDYAIPNMASNTLDPKVLVLPEGSSSLLWYSSEVYDDEWLPFEEQNLVNFGYFYLESNGYCILEGYDDTFYHIDPTTCKVTWTLPMESEDYKNEFIGYDEATNEYVFYDRLGETISRYTLSGEKTSEKVLAVSVYQKPDSEAAETWEEYFAGTFAEDLPKLFAGKIYYPICNVSTKEYSIVIEDGDHVTVIPLNNGSSYIKETYPSPDGSYILVKDGKNTYTLVDVPAGTAEPFSHTLDLEETRIAWNQDGSILAASDMGRVRLFQGDSEIEIQTAGKTVIDLEFLGDMLLVVYSDGNLIRYYAQDGSYIGQSDISANQGFSDYTSVNWIFTNEDIYVVSIDDTFNLIDPETWSVYNTIGNVIAYDLENRLIVVPRTLQEEEIQAENEKYELGYFHLYTTEDLVNKAEKALNGKTLTDEQASQYGIG